MVKYTQEAIVRGMIVRRGFGRGRIGRGGHRPSPLIHREGSRGRGRLGGVVDSIPEKSLGESSVGVESVGAVGSPRSTGLVRHSLRLLALASGKELGGSFFGSASHGVGDNSLVGSLEEGEFRGEVEDLKGGGSFMGGVAPGAIRDSLVNSVEGGGIPGGVEVMGSTGVNLIASHGSDGECLSLISCLANVEFTTVTGSSVERTPDESRDSRELLLEEVGRLGWSRALDALEVPTVGEDAGREALVEEGGVSSLAGERTLGLTREGHIGDSFSQQG